MTIEELKQRISIETGIPADLLDGETAEENIAKAKALLAYKRQHEIDAPKDTRDQFAEWLLAQGELIPDPAGAALAQIENDLRVVPVMCDAGEANNPSYASARDAFSKWMEQAF